MRRVAGGSLIVAAGLAVAASGAAGSGSALKVTVKPRSGGPRTHFVVRFRAPARTGVVGTEQRRYEVRTSGKGTDCAQSSAASVPPTHKGQRVLVRLSGPWCAASYRGRVLEIERPYCRHGQVCAAFIQIRMIGRFSFRVMAPASDMTPPTFAGVQHAVQCFPGPQTPGEQRPVGLSWAAATDGVTPSSSITYDIYMASSGGAENFSQPNWTTSGVTSFTTPDLPPGRFFVVRARDAAGNEDHNTVERQAENPCL